MPRKKPGSNHSLYMICNPSLYCYLFVVKATAVFVAVIVVIATAVRIWWSDAGAMFPSVWVHISFIDAERAGISDCAGSASRRAPWWCQPCSRGRSWHWRCCQRGVVRQHAGVHGVAWPPFSLGLATGPHTPHCRYPLPKTRRDHSRTPAVGHGPEKRGVESLGNVWTYVLGIPLVSDCQKYSYDRLR